MSAREAERRTPPSRHATWLVAAVAVGWLVAYNVMRLTGSSPQGAAWPSLAIGGAAGVAVFLAALAGGRALRRDSPTDAPEAGGVPEPAELSPAPREALRVAAYALGALALAALALGAYVGAGWLTDGPEERSTTALVLAGWNLLVGLWLGDEANRAYRGQADGTDSAVLGCALTAVLAGVGLERGLAEPAQVVVIVLAALAGAAAGAAMWRVKGGRGVPVAAIVAVVVAALALAVPLL